MQVKFQKNLRTLISLLLLVVLVTIQFLGILHVHIQPIVHADQSFQIKEHHTVSAGHHELVISSSHCEICDFAFHQHSPFLQAALPAFVYLLPEIITITKPEFGCQVFEASVQCWTNKGPPFYKS